MKDSWEGLKILRRAGGLGEGLSFWFQFTWNPLESIGIHDLTAQSQNGSKRIQYRVPSKQCVEPVVIESIGFRSPEFDLG